jgi:2-keto-4-pentenoate hydratase/2-oxohepta-3-ene-1,7-dioic acid hydratase in catechol pathway
MIFRKSKKQENNDTLIETPKTDVNSPQNPKETFPMFSSYFNPFEQMANLQSEAMMPFPAMVNNAIFGHQHQLPYPQSKENILVHFMRKLLRNK